jgi:hypothetical protein
MCASLNRRLLVYRTEIPLREWDSLSLGVRAIFSLRPSTAEPYSSFPGGIEPCFLGRSRDPCLAWHSIRMEHWSPSVEHLSIGHH